MGPKLEAAEAAEAAEEEVELHSVVAELAERWDYQQEAKLEQQWVEILLVPKLGFALEREAILEPAYQ